MKKVEPSHGVSSLLVNAEDVRIHRSSLMGFAILWVMLFHLVDLPILNKGYMGVDIFFFLSAIGLCYSFEKNSNLKLFYCKRALRIVPTWWLAILVASIIGSLLMSWPHPSNVGEMLLFFSGVGYWFYWAFHPSLHVVYYEWYIPTLLVFYILFPFLSKIKSVSLLVLLILWEIMIWYCCDENGVRLPWSFKTLVLPRFSIFVYGILYYRCFLASSSLRTAKTFAVAIMASVVLVALCGVTKEHFYIILLMPFILKVLCVLIRVSKAEKMLAFLGGLSLELYLVHLYWSIPELTLANVTIHRYVVLLSMLLLFIALAVSLKVCSQKILRIADMLPKRN